MNYFTFDGIDSRTYNTYIATSNAFDAPGREDEVIKVPGSNNIYYLTEGTYKPFDIKLYCYIPSNMQVKTDDLRNFLLTKGTCRYTEAIRPNEFRVARFIEAYEIEVSDRVSAAFVLTFKAQPQRYLISNDPITTTATADTTTDTTMSLSTVPTPINISLNGNTTQEGSSGKNLIPRPYHQADGTYQGVTWTTDNMGKITASGTTTAGTNFLLTDNSSFSLRAGTYTLSVTGTLIGLDLKIYNGSAILATIANGSVNGKITFTLSTAQNIRTYFNTGYSNVSVNFSVYVQLEKGSTATAYEPHISPTNPQDIHNVSGDNTVNVASFNVWDEISFVSSSRIQSQNYIPVLPNTAYYRKSPNNILVTYYNANKEQLSTGTWGTGLFTTPQNCNFIKFMVDPAYGTTYKHDICINVSDTQKNGTYEPYTRQSYPLYLPVENLLTVENGESTVGGVTFKNTDKGIQINGSTPSSTFMVLYNGTLPSGDYTISGMDSGASATTYQIVIYKNGSTILYYRDLIAHTFSVVSTDSILIRLFVYSGQGEFGGKTIPLQLEKGTKANHYTPYGTPPIELNKIGTYQDYIYKNGGKWYVHKEFSKVDLGTLTWGYSPSGLKFYASLPNGLIYTADTSIVMGSGRGRATGLTIVQKAHNKLTDYEAIVNARYINNTQSWIATQATAYTTARDFKTAVTGIELIYAINATNTEITDTTLINQLNNIEKAYSYNGTTNILQVSNDNGFMLSVLSLHANNVSSTYKGEPIITVNSTGLIYFNGCVIKVNQAPMTINSQTMQAYNGTVNLNNYIEANDFPMIEAGNNVIGSEMPLSIVPNYWKL